MGRNDAIKRLRKASAASTLWRGFADDGILGPLTASVEHSAEMSLRDAISNAHEHGLSVDEIANEALVPYRVVYLLTR